jgi:cephalosporin-C deacetylase-like acetyl esterase
MRLSDANPKRLMLALCCVGVLATGIFHSTAAERQLEWKVVAEAERPEALYDLGETVSFRVEVLDEKGESADVGSLDYVLSVDGFRELEKHSLALTGAPLLIEGQMDRPGFLRLDVSHRRWNGAVTKGAAAAGVAVDDLTPSREAPVDFEAFWDEQKARLAEVPLNWQETSVPSGVEGIVVADVQVEALDGVPVSGYVALPEQARPKSLPAVLWVHGAGVRSSLKGQAVDGARQGFLSMDINAHGLPNGKPEEFYKKLEKEDLEQYRIDGRENRDGVYFKNMFLRLVRAIDYLTARTEWDGRCVAVVGHSQGGAQALVAGGLDGRVTFIGAGVPAMCDHTGMLRKRPSGWPKFVPILESGKPDPMVAEVSRYYDAVNFAARCHCDAIMSIGFLDRACPPTSCFVAYNQLKGDKRLLAEVAMGHSAPAEVRAEFLAALKAHVESLRAGEEEE